MLMILLIFFIIIISPQAVVSETQQDNMEKLTEALDEVKKVSQKEGIGDVVEIEQKGNTAKITMKSGILFDSGSSELSPAGQEDLKILLESLKSLSHTHSFHIQGHTDSIPIKNHRYQSNWHLSTDRALVILDQFISLGFEPKSLSAQGFAEYRPLVPNTDEAGKDLPENRAKNRRVEIRIK
jgi:chemotaxis protein MotB